jgi:CheY-like chemotaxis protein
LRILIADDDSDFRKVTGLLLSGRGYKVLEARSGREAVDLARQVQPDLILLDVLMPGLDGYEACRQIRTNPATSHIPIIVLTAVADPAVCDKAQQAGADDCIAKLAVSRELHERMERLLRRYNLFHGARRRADGDN